MLARNYIDAKIKNDLKIKQDVTIFVDCTCNFIIVKAKRLLMFYEIVDDSLVLLRSVTLTNPIIDDTVIDDDEVLCFITKFSCFVFDKVKKIVTISSLMDYINFIPMTTHISSTYKLNISGRDIDRTTYHIDNDIILVKQDNSIRVLNLNKGFGTRNVFDRKVGRVSRIAQGIYCSKDNYKLVSTTSNKLMDVYIALCLNLI